MLQNEKAPRDCAVLTTQVQSSQAETFSNVQNVTGHILAGLKAEEIRLI